MLRKSTTRPPSPAPAPAPAVTMSGAGADAVEVAGRLRMSVTRLARLMRRQDESGLTPTLRAALAAVERHGPLTLGELAAREQVSAPTTTNVVTKLAARGLVHRRVDESDRRVCWVEVSAAGKRQLAENRNRRTEWLAARLQDLPPDDLARLAAALDVLEELTTIAREREES